MLKWCLVLFLDFSVVFTELQDFNIINSLKKGKRKGNDSSLMKHKNKKCEWTKSAFIVVFGVKYILEANKNKINNKFRNLPPRPKQCEFWMHKYRFSLFFHSLDKSNYDTEWCV